MLVLQFYQVQELPLDIVDLPEFVIQEFRWKASEIIRQVDNEVTKENRLIRVCPLFRMILKALQQMSINSLIFGDFSHAFPELSMTYAKSFVNTKGALSLLTPAKVSLSPNI